MKLKKVLVIGLVLVINLFRLEGQGQKIMDNSKIVDYLLIDRNSPEVFYWDDPYFKERGWSIKIKKDTLVKLFQRSTGGYSGKDDREMLRKPLSFLDSISYYEERYLWCTDSLRMKWRKYPDLSLYLLDKGTILNDSISMYRINFQEKEKRFFYVVLDRNSSFVNYRESKDMRVWTFMCLELETSFFQCKWPEPQKADFWKIIRKPVSFVDSISYYDEKWLSTADGLPVKLSESPESSFEWYIYVLDKGTVRNDSISMYRVKCSGWGRE